MEKIVTREAVIAEQMEKVYKKADRVSRYYLLGAFVLGVAIAPIYETWFFALGIGGLSLLLFFIATYLIPNKLIGRLLISCSYAFIMLQMIGQMHGMAEMHFVFFINTAVLILYHDWRIMVPHAILTVAHHSTFFYLQMMGFENMGIYFINYTQVDFMVLAFHFGLAIFMALVGAFLAFDLEKRLKRNIDNIFRGEIQLGIMNKGIQFAQQISGGNLDNVYEISNQDDELGKALVEMQKNLKDAAAKETQEKYINIGIARVSKILQDNLNDLKTMGSAVLKEIVNYLGVNQAGLFVVEHENEDTALTLIAAYAYNRKKFIKKKVLIGEFAEGILGQAYLEKEMIYLDNVPQDYLSISSGLGETSPRFLLVWPLMVNEEVVGILEMASFEQLEEYKLEYLTRVSENLASTISTGQVNANTQKLLKTTQEQAEQLRAVEEELRQNMEELQATQEAMQRKQQELQNANLKMMANEKILKKALERSRNQEKELKALKASLNTESVKS